jgi:hypothetical protein
MDSVSRALLMTGGSSAPPPGQQAYTTAGTFTWVAPAGVTSVSVVCVGSGGNGISLRVGSSDINASASGGGLGWKNSIAVTPGASYTVVVGGPNADSYFINTSTVRGGPGAWGGNGGTFTGDGGGNGGGYAFAASSGGGGAGGYTGSGGNGGTTFSPGSGGGGASGASPGSGGGGVGILGQGTSGTTAAQGGSGGSNGFVYDGGVYGGGGGTGPTTVGTTTTYGIGGGGAVRIIWPGTTRVFPSTNTGNV